MIKGLIHSGLSTNNLNGSIDFYTKAFGFEVIFKEEKIQEEIESITGIESQRCSLAQLSFKGSDHIIELLQLPQLSERNEQWKRSPEHPATLING